MAALMGNDFSLNFPSDMFSNAVLAPQPVSSGSGININTSGLFSTLTQQAPGLFNSYLQKRITAITKPKAAPVYQAPAPTAAPQQPSINMPSMTVPVLLIIAGTGAYTYSEKNKGGRRGRAR